MNNTKISYEQLISLAEQLKTSSQNMESILNEIKILFNRIGNPDVWAGASAEAAKAKFNMLSSKFPEFYNATRKCHTHFKLPRKDYNNVA